MYIQNTKKFINLVLLLAGFLISGISLKANAASLIINEILPAPKTQSYEWVEIVNISNQTIHSSEIEVKDKKGTLLKLNFQTLAPGEYAIATSNSILNNSGDKVVITLKNSSEVIDEYEYGKTNYDLSWGRCPDKTGNFVLLSTPTQKEKNTCPNPTLTLTPNPSQKVSPTLSPTLSFTPTPTPLMIVELSEFYPNPNSGESEWIEIYNPNNFEANLNNWKLDDEEEGSTPITFSSIIPPKGFFVLTLKSNILNNDGDTVRLLNEKEEIMDQTTYSSSTKGKSWAKNNGKWCKQNPTKGFQNHSCLTNPTSTPTPTPTQTKNNLVSSSNSSKQKSTTQSYSYFPNQNKNTIKFATFNRQAILGASIKSDAQKGVEILNFDAIYRLRQINFLLFISSVINGLLTLYFSLKLIKLV